MHIPDGFLSTPVWFTLDVVGVPAIGILARRAQKETDESKAPLLGVMGAFIFAAQMINFPVGVGTSSHLIGSALLVYTLGLYGAVVVMTAVLALQALVFQDGGILALGANVLNIAVAGVWAAHLPYRYWGSSHRDAAMFAGGVLSVLVSAILALSELMISGVRMPGPILGVSLGLFLVTGLIEGAITVGVMRALGAINPRWIRDPAAQGRPVMGLIAVSAVLLATVGILFASSNPDGLERLAENIGIADRARNLVETPLADYQAEFLESSWPRQAVAGLAGLLAICGIGFLLGKLLARRRSI